MGENLVLYKDLSGTFGLVDRHCPHRRADMSYGWVEAQRHPLQLSRLALRRDRRLHRSALRGHHQSEAVEVRLRDQGLSGARDGGPAVGLHGPAARARVAGVGAVQLAERLPRDRAGRRAVQLVPGPGELHRSGALRMDARQLERTGMQGDDKTAPKHLKLKFEEFEHGFTYKRVREGQSEEDNYWTVGRVALWPNGFYLGRHFEWRVPVDDENTLSVAWFFVRVPKGREPYVQNSVPTWKSPIRGEDGRWITSHVINQDIVAWVGQGTIADRTQEHLRSSDIGITMMRNRFFEEIGGDQGRPRAEGRDPRSEPGAGDRPARHGARTEHGRHHARGIPERSAAAPAAQGIPPPLRPAARGAGGVRRGDGDCGRNRYFAAGARSPTGMARSFLACSKPCIPSAHCIPTIAPFTGCMSASGKARRRMPATASCPPNRAARYGSRPREPAAPGYGRQ